MVFGDKVTPVVLDLIIDGLAFFLMTEGVVKQPVAYLEGQPFGHFGILLTPGF